MYCNVPDDSPIKPKRVILYTYMCVWTNNTNSVAFSLQATYTDWATATGQQILVSTFVDRRELCGQCSGPLQLFISVF
jgi:hypothetical protein